MRQLCETGVGEVRNGAARDAGYCLPGAQTQTLLALESCRSAYQGIDGQLLPALGARGRPLCRATLQCLMPSFHHEALLQLFRNRPLLAPELLRDALHQLLPEFSEARIESADLTDIQPAEYRADLVVLLLEERPVLGIVIEAQLGRDEAKRYAWPAYVTCPHQVSGVPVGDHCG